MTTHQQNPVQPTLFIPHGGGPCFFMDDPAGTWRSMEAYLRDIMPSLPARPRAILVISGHWEADRFLVTSTATPRLIYDYTGFPKHTYELTYPAPGAPTLALSIRDLLTKAGLPAGVDSERGLDHGVFIPLKVAVPDADIPVLQLSLRKGLDPKEHLAAGHALRSLRDDNVLIVGSGMSFHNMRGYGDPQFGPVSDQFDAWLTTAVTALGPERNRLLAAWSTAPSGRTSHPTEEHLLPLMVAAGAAPNESGRRVYSDRVLETTISAYRFGA